jgi:hypothetical protein
LFIRKGVAEEYENVDSTTDIALRCIKVKKFLR